MVRKTRGVTACVTLAAASTVLLPSCGSPISANRDWITSAGFVLHSHGPNGQLAAGNTFFIAGNVLDQDGSVRLDQKFQESCSVVFPGSGQPPAAPLVDGAADVVGGGGVWDCEFILNTGDRVYVATGPGPFAMTSAASGPR